jgi:hypothetical protein
MGDSSGMFHYPYTRTRHFAANGGEMSQLLKQWLKGNIVWSTWALPPPFFVRSLSVVLLVEDFCPQVVREVSYRCAKRFLGLSFPRQEPYCVMSSRTVIHHTAPLTQGCAQAQMGTLCTQILSFTGRHLHTHNASFSRPHTLFSSLQRKPRTALWECWWEFCSKKQDTHSYPGTNLLWNLDHLAWGIFFKPQSILWNKYYDFLQIRKQRLREFQSMVLKTFTLGPLQS